MAYVENPVAYERARIARIRANARVGKAQRWLAEDATRQAVVDFLNGPNLRGDFLCKMADSLREWGSLTEKQEAAVRKCMTGNAERDAKRAQENAAAAPLPAFDGRATIEGTVLTIKVVEGRYGTAIKMLVKHADGWKVWGTCPASLECEKGDTVRFEAKVEPSRDDPKFGFYSRPSKSEIVARATVDTAGNSGNLQALAAQIEQPPFDVD